MLRSTMRRLHFLVTLIFYCVSNPAWSEPATWLMQGDTISDDEAASRFIHLNTYKRYFPISTRMEVYFRAEHGDFISCVIAAAIHQQGQVSVEEGGYNAEEVRIRYATKNGKPDVFFVLIQTARRESISIEGNVAENTRVGIVYEPVRNWTLDGIQDALRNVTTSHVLLS